MQGMKIGMHIDAVMEFVVEYPLDWPKERRLDYGSSDGEVRWTHPEDPAIKLRIISHQRKQVETAEQKLALALPEHPSQIVMLNESTTLPAGAGRHLRVQTERNDLEAYLLTSTNRDFMIVLIAPRDRLSEYGEVMARISQSFIITQ
jgi:hypothetical protein